MECQEEDSILNTREKKNDTNPFKVENNLLSKLRNCTLIPRTLSDFQAFVGRLVNDSISEAVVQEVWRQIYLSSDNVQFPINNNQLSDSSVVSQVNCQVGEFSENSNEAAELSEVDSANATKESHQMVSNDYAPKSENQTNVFLEEKQDYASSSDCEVVEVVSLNKSNEGDNNHTCSTCGGYNTDSCESESDKSVEILELKISSKTDTSSDEEQPCRIHGRTGYQNSYNIPEYPNCASQETQKCFQHLNTDLSVKQIDVSTGNFGNRKRKKLKYKKLKSEVKNLKRLLENLLTNVDGSVTGNAKDIRENVSSLSSVDIIHKAGVSAKKKVKTKELPTKDCNILEGRIYSSQKKRKEIKFQREDKTILHDTFNSATDEKNTPKITKVAADLLKKKLQSTEHSKTVHEFRRSSEKIHDLKTPLNTTEKKRMKFKWREVIADTLKANEGNRMQVEKLKRKVIANYYYYRGNISKNTKWKFFKYLRTTPGVVIDADVAIFNNKMKTQISLSESKKQYVKKTVTRTREYKMS